MFIKMKYIIIIFFIIVCVCNNHIKYSDNVIWDRVIGSEKVSLDEKKIDQGTLEFKIRFVCLKRQYTVTNDYLTPYRGSDELYEVPVGLISFPFSLLWFGVTLGGDSAPLDWSAAGFNPLLNVENGMFAERYVIHEKENSRRPQEGSSPEPYDSILAPYGGIVKAQFDGGESMPISVGKELALVINLVELAQVIPTPDSQKIILEMDLLWTPKAPPIKKKIEVFINKELSSKLYELKEASETLLITDDYSVFLKALTEVENAGFSKEAAMIKDKRKNDFRMQP